MASNPTRITFAGNLGNEIAARLDLPPGPVRAYALFAHCFTCSKDVIAARYIAAKLASLGIAVLRFDFTGLGSSQGEFASTDFSSNIEDLVLAADYLRATFAAPALLIGHSLGGAAVLAAAHHIPEARAVATIAAPSDVAHVLEHFKGSLADIERDGIANVTLAGRTFQIRREFIENARGQALKERIANLRRALLVMHSPTDQTVGIEHATAIFLAAKHPKSFVSLDGADHLLADHRDANYAAEVIAAWASRYIGAEREAGATAEPEAVIEDGVISTETGAGHYQNSIAARRHHFLADEPVSVGGLDSGPNPYDLLAAALAACTSMTLRMYSDRSGLGLDQITVRVEHGKVPTEHCADCGEALAGRTGKIDRFERVISVRGGADATIAAKLVEIAGKCPVHRTLEGGSAVVTRVADDKG